jgi:hypothetical protein
MAWCGCLRADHGQKQDPGDEIIIQRDLTNEGPLQKNYRCTLIETLNQEVSMTRRPVDNRCIKRTDTVALGIVATRRKGLYATRGVGGVEAALRHTCRGYALGVKSVHHFGAGRRGGRRGGRDRS